MIKRDAKDAGDRERREREYVREEAQGSGGGGDRASSVLTRVILIHREHPERRFHVRKKSR